MNNRNDILNDILETVCNYFGEDPEVIKGPSQKSEICNIRHMFCFIIKKNFPYMSTKEIGKFLGNRDHATVTHSIKLVRFQEDIFNKHQQKTELYTTSKFWSEYIQNKYGLQDKPRNEQMFFTLEQAKKHDGFFHVTSTCRDDLIQEGFNVSNVDDNIMIELASKLAYDYYDQLYWSSLRDIADILNIPKLKGEENG